MARRNSRRLPRPTKRGGADLAPDGEAQDSKNAVNAPVHGKDSSANPLKANRGSKDEQSSAANSDGHDAAEQRHTKVPAIDLDALQDQDAVITAATSEATAVTDRRNPLTRSPRTRSILGDQSESTPQETTKMKDQDVPLNAAGTPIDASTDRRKPLARSPHTRAILDDHNESAPPAAKSKPQEAMEASPENKKKTAAKKDTFGALKALKSRKETSVRESSGDRKEQTHSQAAANATEAIADAKTDEQGNLLHSDSGQKQSPSSSRRMDTNTRPEGLESTTFEQQDGEKNHTSKSDSKKKQDASKQTSNPLSPLRRRKQDRDSRATGSDVPGSRLKLRDLFLANQLEVHIVGEITSGEGFGRGGFACKWGVEYGSTWHHIAGDQLGQTQIDYPSSSAHPIIWSHPIDLHFATASLQGWPKLLFQVWQIDTHMKSSVTGYGFVHLPFSPGEYHLSVALWRPMGSAKVEMEATFFGRTHELVTDDVVFSSAWAERCRLQIIATGKLHLHVGILLRNFEMLGMEM